MAVATIDGRPAIIADNDVRANSSGTPTAGSLSVLLGNGDGTFQPAVTYTVGNSSSVLAVGNVNGQLDIVTVGAGGSSETVSVLRGNSNGTFQPAATYPIQSSADSVAVGDFNGFLDVVTTGSTFDNTVSVLLGRSDGSFQPASTYTVGNSPLAVATGDFNNDATPDIVTANYDGGTVSVLLGRGDGTFSSPATLATGDSPSAMAVGAFTHSGNLDLLTANLGSGTSGSVSVLLGNGDGTFQPAVNYAVGRDPVAVAVGDFNNDGNLDIATANNNTSTVSVLLGRGDGSFLPAVSYAVGAGPIAMAVGDFNNNGNLDIVTVNQGTAGVSLDFTLSVLLGNGDGTFQPAVTYPLSYEPTAVAVGDFNHDGKLDLVIANESATVSVLRGNGNGTFGPAVYYSVKDAAGNGGSELSSLTVGDFTNDGNLDIVTANDGDNTVSVLKGNGDGTFQQPATTYPVENASVLSRTPQTSLATGDLNGDGNLGIVSANILDNTVSVLLGNGNGTFKPAATYSVGYSGTGLVGASADAVAVGDFKDDGKLDIVTTRAIQNTVALLTGEGNGQFEPSTPADGIAIRNVPYLQDLNGDGIPDELILNSSGDVLFRQGLGPPDQFAPPVTINPGEPARDATVFRTAAGLGRGRRQ